MIMIVLKTQLQTDMFRDEKNYKSHRKVNYNLAKSNCKDWDSIVSVGKLFQSRIDLGS